MAALLDPLRNTLDHLALDPKAREDRRYLVSMLRRLGYSEREIEQVLGWEGDGPRVIEVEYVPPGQGPAPGSFTVVDDWDEPAPAADGTVGFSVARDTGDAARAYGWLPADDDALAHGWLPDTVEFREQGSQWEPMAQEQAWPEEDAEWTDGDTSGAWPEEREWPQDDAEAEQWPEAGQWPAADEQETWPQDETALPEASEPEVQEADAEGQWRVVEDDPWSDTEADWAQEPMETEVEAWDQPAEAWDEPAAETWDEPAAEVEVPTPAPSQEWDAPADYAITEAPAGSWPAPFTYEEYTLYTRTVELSTGREQRIFFFAKSEPKSGQPCALPPGYIVETNERTGLPFLRRDPQAQAVDVSDWGAEDAQPDTSADVACLAITKAGTQCRNAPREHSKYCSVHKGWRGPRVE